MLQFEEIEWTHQNKSSIEKTILFLSDLHMICDSELASEKKDVRDYVRDRRIYLENSGIGDTKRLFDEFSHYIKQQKIDFVIFGGDIIDSPSSENLNVLFQMLKALNTPYIFTSGNHDWNYSWDYLSKESKVKYQPLLAESAKKSSLDGVVEEYQGITFLVVDSSSNRISEKSLEMICRLDKKKPLCVVMHVPYTTAPLRELSLRKWGFETTMGGKGLPMDAITRAFLNEMEAFDDVLLLCGHVHDFSDDRLSSHVRQVVAPAACEEKAVIIHLKGFK